MPATSSAAAEAPPPSAGAEIRSDSVFGRCVLFSPARARRPSDFKARSPASDSKPNSSCAFCAGREGECAPEIFRIPAGSGDGLVSVFPWKIRVIENLYPALRRDVDPPGPREGLDDLASWEGRCAVAGYGFQDVVIETPDHFVHLQDLSPKEIGEVILAYRKRTLQLAALGSIKFVQVFKNYGASAGASIAHSHSQIMGLPLVPPLVSAWLVHMKRSFDLTGKCCLCDIRSEDTLINETPHFFAIVPFAASYPFEVWIVPRNHSAHFHDIDQEKAGDLASLLKLLLQKLSKQLNDPPYNFVIQTAPLDLSSSCLPYIHWFLQIVPRLSVMGGFEIGTGCFINPVFPEDAAKVLREVDLST